MTESVSRFFKWSDDSGNFATSNLSVQGFIAAIDYMIYDTSYTKQDLSVLTHIPLNDLLLRVPIFKGIKYNLYRENVLDELAEQFNVLGWQYAGKYNITTTVQDRKNDFLKVSGDILRHAGTAYAIYMIMTQFGYTNVIVHENWDVGILYDGVFDYDGKAIYSGSLDNQLFVVEFTSDHDIDSDEQDAIVDLINSYKKYRIELYALIIHEPSNPGGRTEVIWP